MTFTEKIAEDIWWKVKQSWEWDVRLGEETLTDLLVLDFVRFKPGNYRLFPSTKPGEWKRGTDLEIRIHDVGNHAAKLAIQAKKLLPPAKTKPYQIGKYRLDPKAKCQMDTLEDYSKKNDAVPLYLLYNYVNRCNISPYWHCCQCADEKQLGCTLVPSRNIRQAISKYGCKNFDWIHKSRSALPWHCFFDCTQRRGHQGQSAARRILSLLGGLFQPSDDLAIGEILIPSSDDDEQNYNWVRFDPVEDAWPDWLWDQPGTTLSASERRQLWGDFGETVAMPRHLLLVKDSE